MEKEEILKKYIDEIKTHRFYELIPNLNNGEVIIDKGSINLDDLTFTSFLIRKGKVFDELMTSDHGNYPHPISIVWNQLLNDGFITEKDLNCAVEKCNKTYESMQKDTKKYMPTDEEIEKCEQLFVKFAEFMSMDLAGVSGKKTPFSEFARVIKEMDDIISKGESKK